jgi:aryl-alcohol dehydrogenase-like predicted oxidoreductase
VLSTLDLGFANVHSLLKTTKQEGKLMSMAISYVSQWLNCDPARVGERDNNNNKLPLRNDFLPALQERCRDTAKEQSIKLQEQLLKYVRDNSGNFTSLVIGHFLHEYLDSNRDAYTQRFEHQAWRNMLILVV